jgi:arginyl-tRNA synthetase
MRNSIHFSYEMVVLTHACAETLGFELSPEDRKRPYVEVSGRKGLGVKADDLLSMLEAEARREVRERNPELAESEISEIGRQIAVAALRFFLLKYTRTAIIAFDFKEALSFDGETGPYLQYACVRAANILRKMSDLDESFSAVNLPGFLAETQIDEFLDDADDIWDLVYAISRLDEIASQTIETLEPATLAKYAFSVAQRFNLFYHRYKIISEPDVRRRQFYLSVVELALHALVRTLDMMGMQVPQRM